MTEDPRAAPPRLGAQASSPAPRLVIRPAAVSTPRLVAASALALPELCEAYNRGRSDYLIPMPMSQARLAAYMRVYDIDLARSWAVTLDGAPMGLGLLGLRGERAWISRLGLAPELRREGMGRRLVTALLDEARAAGGQIVGLEVIEDNLPARALFESLGFRWRRSLLVLRRPPREVPLPPAGWSWRASARDEALRMLGERADDPSWLTETRSLERAGPICALSGMGPQGESAALVYQAGAWELSRMVLLAREHSGRLAALRQMHFRHPLQDAVLENLQGDDAAVGAYLEAGYLRAFTRVEMTLGVGQASGEI